MPPKRRSAVVAVVPLAADVPFSPGAGHTAEEYIARKERTTSWALNNLANSQDLAQWGNQLRSQAKRWQRAFTAAMIMFTLALAGLGYEVATHHAGSGIALGSSFRENFDNLSGSSQQALQQLATKSAKLLPEGTSIRDSFEKLSDSSQHALYHLVKSGIPLPSLLPYQNIPHDASASSTSQAADLVTQLSDAEADFKASEAAVRAAHNDLSALQAENNMLSDLLKRSQADLQLSQGHTHELLASIAQHDNKEQAFRHQHNGLQKQLTQAAKTIDSLQQSNQCIFPATPAAPMGALDWVLSSLVGANTLLLLFFLAPGRSAESVRSSTSSRLGRAFHAIQSTLFPMKKSPRKRAWAEIGALDALDSAGSGKIPGYALEGLTSPVKKASAARSLAGKSSPSKIHASTSSPRKAALASPLPVKSTDADVAPVDESSTPTAAHPVDGQQTAVYALTQERENSIKHCKEAEARLQQTAADLKQKEQALATASAAKSAAEGKQAQLSEQLESAQQQQQDQAKTNAELALQLEQANSRKSAAMEDLAKRKDEIDKLGEQLQSAQQHVESVQADLGRINKQLQETKQQLAASESAKDSFQESASGQAAEISQLTKDLASATSDKETAEAMLSQIRAEATQKGNDLSKIKSGKENAEQGLQVSQAEAAKLANDLAEIQAGKSTMELELKQKKSDLKIRVQELEGARRDRDAACKEVKQLQSAKSELASRVKEMENQLTTSRAARAKLEKTSKQSAAEVSQLKQELSDATTGKSAAEADLQKTSQQLTAAQKDLKQLASDKAELDSKLVSASADHDSTEKTLQQLRAECSSLTEQLAAAQSGKFGVDDRLHKVSEQLKSAMEDYNAVKTQCSDLSQELQVVKTDKSAAEDALNKNQGNLQQLTQQLESRQSAFEQLESHKADLSRKLTASVSQKAQVEDELRRHKSELERLSDELKIAQKTSRELWSVKDHLNQSEKELAHTLANLEASQETNQQMSAIIKGIDVEAFSEIAEQVESIGKKNAELADLRHQKSMEANALHHEKEEALAALRQQAEAALEVKNEELQLYRNRLQDYEEQLQTSALANGQREEEEGETTNQYEQDLAEKQTQLADAKKRIFELELRLNASQLQSASSDPLAVRKDGQLARGWKLTGLHDLRTSAFGSFVTSQTSSAHQANTSPGALGRSPLKLSSHPVGSPEVSSHAIADGSPIPSHALQPSPSNSPASSVGSVTGNFPRPSPGSPARTPAARAAHAPSRMSLSPFQAFTGANNLTTPQSVASFMTGGSDIASHAVQHSSSSSGNDAATDLTRLEPDS